MRRYSDREVLRIAAARTLKRIRHDRRRAPQTLKKLFSVILRDLFKPRLKSEYAWDQAGIRDHALGAVFKQLTEVSLKQYIHQARIEVAKILISTTDLDLATISMMIGYDYHPTFAKNFKLLDGRLPSKVPRLGTDGPTIDDVTAIMYVRGELSHDEADDFLNQSLPTYPRLAKQYRQPAPMSRRPLIIVEGERQCRLMAGGLWLEIRDLSFEEQRWEVRGYLFYTEALFDLLREKSRQRGRQNSQHGIELAKLALVSLEQSDEVFGDRIHDLRAMGWAWLGNAHRIAGDFSAADGAFEEADREWAVPRVERDRTVLASICDLKGTLRMYQRAYDEAKRLLDQSCSLYRHSKDDYGEAVAMMQRATVSAYAGEAKGAVEDLRSAERLINEHEQKATAFVVRGNLANALARAKEYSAATKELGRARELYSETEDPIGKHKLDWIDGFIREGRGDIESAERLYDSARAGFWTAGEGRDFAIISVDLMVLRSKRDGWEDVLELATEALPILESLKLHGETVAAVSLLAQAVRCDNVSRHLLRNLRELLTQDPLAKL